MSGAGLRVLKQIVELGKTTKDFDSLLKNVSLHNLFYLLHVLMLWFEPVFILAIMKTVFSLNMYYIRVD